MPVEHRHVSAAASADALATDVSARLGDALQQRAHAFLAVSGGRSPIGLLEALSHQVIDWAQVSVILVDERCVPEEHPDSNSALVRRHLLRGCASVARFVPFFHLTTPVTDPAALGALQTEAEARLAPLPWPLDVAVLGMGEDGHTASLFPDSLGLDLALTTTSHCAWTRPTHAKYGRLTLSLGTLLQARHLALLIAGPRKQAVYARALQGSTHDLPVSLLLCQGSTPISTWMAP